VQHVIITRTDGMSNFSDWSPTAVTSSLGLPQIDRRRYLILIMEPDRLAPVSTEVRG